MRKRENNCIFPSVNFSSLLIKLNKNNKNITRGKLIPLLRNEVKIHMPRGRHVVHEK